MSGWLSSWPRRLALLGAVVAPSWSQALEIQVEENDFGPFGQTTSLHLSGDILPGDSAVLASRLTSLSFPPGSTLSVVFNSPGGSLLEGMEIGRLLARQLTDVATDVGDTGLGPGSCASACVLAYLGGHYRYLRDGSRLGIHQFYPGEGTTMSGAEGVAIGQVLSAEIVTYLGEMRADPDFFRQMTQASPDDIIWVSREELEAKRVVTGPIFDQQAEYKNAEGLFYLLLWQQSYYGLNKMVVACQDRQPIFMSFLMPPDLRFVHDIPHQLSVTINGVEERPMTWTFEGIDDTWAKASFFLSRSQLEDLRIAQSFGARMQVPGADVFFGIDFPVTDRKLADTIGGCLEGEGTQYMGSASGAPPAGGMTVLAGRDIPGGDITSEGVRGVDFNECQAICLGDATCVAVTWVPESTWCWPKGVAGDIRVAPGLMSALKN